MSVGGTTFLGAAFSHAASTLSQSSSVKVYPVGLGPSVDYDESLVLLIKDFCQFLFKRFSVKFILTVKRECMWSVFFRSLRKWSCKGSSASQM